MNDISKLCKMIEESKDVYVLTGAGMSTDSGIPDFRSSNKGLWEKIDPMKALSASVLYNNPNKFYKEGFKLLMSMTNAKPNDGHFILAKLEKLKYIKGIITQNIDNLHIDAGSKFVLEVHGDTRAGKCLNCQDIVDIDIIKSKIENEEIPPRCNICNGILRPNVVLFEDQLPHDFEVAWEIVKDCDLLIVIGSSLSVAPVSYLPQMADKVVIINNDRTDFDNFSDLIIRNNATKVLKEVFNVLNKGE